ncbi:MAG TPA: hypothetical protein VLU96_05860 [Gaiellaceae bacterium]|nr:hypothetical protein [Gaiellaceae bacterium]
MDLSRLWRWLKPGEPTPEEVAELEESREREKELEGARDKHATERTGSSVTGRRL